MDAEKSAVVESAEDKPVEQVEHVEEVAPETPEAPKAPEETPEVPEAVADVEESLEVEKPAGIARQVVDALTGSRALRAEIADLKTAHAGEVARLQADVAAGAARVAELEKAVAELKPKAELADELTAELQKAQAEIKQAETSARAELAALGVEEEELPAAATGDVQPQLKGRERLIADFKNQELIASGK